MSDGYPVSLADVFEGLTQVLPLVGFVLTAEGEITSVISDAASEDPHVSQQDTLVGQSLADVFPPATADRLRSAIEAALRTETVQTVTYRIPAASEDRMYEGCVAPVPTDDATEPYVVWIAEDITDQRAYEQQLRRFQQAVEAAGVAVYVTDIDGRIEYVNPAFEEITGYTSEEAIGASPHILHSGEMPDDYFEELWTSLDAGEHWEEQVVNRRKNGERYYAYQTIAPITDDEGDPEAFVAIQRDITDRLALDQERARQHDHLIRTEDLAAVGGWEYEPTTETVRWTEGAHRIFDVSDEYEPNLQEAFAFFHPADRPVLREAFEECLEAGIEFSIDLRIITDRGRQRWVLTRGERVIEDGKTKLIGVIQDITDHKMDEQRLMVLNRVLRHNLRNKLNAVMGCAEELSDRHPEASTALFDQIQQSAQTLLELAEKSRQSNKILEYDYTTEPVALEPLIADLSAEYRNHYPDATVEADSLDVTVPANEMGVYLLLGELIENAIRHNDRPEPTVSITCSRPSDRRVAITVADDGPGLPETEREVLETGEETALIHSDGIGLWTTNWLVTKLSGGISVESDDKRGTSITVTLPVVTPERVP